MILRSQKDPLWKNEMLGTCKYETIGSAGCKIVCFSMACGLTPKEVNEKITYSSGCLTVDSRNAKELGLKYNGRTTTKPKITCIAETNHYKNSGYPQHFYVIRPDGMIADPLDYPCYWKKNPYNVVSYRLIEFKEATMEKTYWIKSDLRNSLKELDEDFDHTKAEDHEKMAGKVESMIDRAVFAEQEAIKTAEECSDELLRKEAEYKEVVDKLNTLNSKLTINNETNKRIITSQLILLNSLETGLWQYKDGEFVEQVVLPLEETLGYHLLGAWTIIWKNIKGTK